MKRLQPKAKPKLTAISRVKRPSPSAAPPLPRLTAISKVDPIAFDVARTKAKPKMPLLSAPIGAFAAAKPVLSAMANPQIREGRLVTQEQAQEQGYYQENGQGQSSEGQQTEEEYSQEYYEEPQKETAKAPDAPINEQLRHAKRVLKDWESDIPWQEMQGFAGEEPSGTTFSEVRGNHLCTTAICKTPVGIFPLVDVRPIEIGAEETLSEAQKDLSMKAVEKQLQLAAESLVIRARQGDQNAMGMIATIRKQAERGNPRARQSLAMLQRYVAAHPVKDTFGTEEQPKKSNVLLSSSVALANGAPLSADTVSKMASTLGDEKSGKLFFYAVVNYNKDQLLEALGRKFGDWAQHVIELGKSVGFANAIQVVRKPGTPITPFSAVAGWELGE